MARRQCDVSDPQSVHELADCVQATFGNIHLAFNNEGVATLDVQGSSTDPGQAVLRFRKFASEGDLGVASPMTGTQWETVRPLANRLQMPAFSVNATKPGITVNP
ncbi:MAG: amino acid transporter substrate-binding protein [Ramlibacter sp.]|nr:amino acid transporter substrate-binding protein [Ramlibacter sp.]